MGQQQLLLLVLGIVTVGLAIVVGIQLFNDRSRKDAADQLLNRNVDITTRAQAWRLKKYPLDGGSHRYDGLKENMTRLAISQTSAIGCHQITEAEGKALEVVGVSIQYPDVGVRTVVEGSSIKKTDMAFDGSITPPLGCETP